MTFDKDAMMVEVQAFFQKRFDEFGANYRGLDYGSPLRQELCFEQLTKIIRNPSAPFSVNDYGCGYGSLIEFLVRRGYTFEYRGYDIIASMIEKARELYAGFPNVTFTGNEADLTEADYTIAGGVFNMKLQTTNEDWTRYLLSSLDKLWALSRKGMAFNILTKYSDADKMRDDLYYADPLFLFDYCKRHYAKDVALLHDYGVYEFTLLVRREG